MLLRCVYVLVLLLCSQSQLLSAQVLSGAYCSGNGYEVTCIDFTVDNRFVYSYAGCTGGARGTGVYTLMGDHLILSFKKNDIVKSPVAWDIDTREANADSVYWQFTVVDEAGETLPGAIVRVVKSDVGTVTDLYGKAQMSFPKNEECLSIVASYYGSLGNTYSTMLCKNNSYKIRVVINDSFTETIEKGTSYRYPIRNIRRSSFELKRDYEGARFEVYKKVIQKRK